MDVNVNGVFHTVQAAAKYMLDQGKGSIIITSSISGAIANRPQLQTCVSSTTSKTC
jgi:sorbose reductase